MNKQPRSWVPAGVASAGVALVLAVAPLAVASTGTDDGTGTVTAADQTVSTATHDSASNTNTSAPADLGGDADKDDAGKKAADAEGETDPEATAAETPDAAETAIASETETATATETDAATATETETAAATATPDSVADAVENESGDPLESHGGTQAVVPSNDPVEVRQTEQVQAPVAPTATAEADGATTQTIEVETPAPAAQVESLAVKSVAAAPDDQSSTADAAPTAATLVMSAASDAVTTAVTPSENLFTVLGSFVFGLYAAVLRLFEGSPTLPAGSTVTVRQSSLTIDVAGGLTVPAYWYFPADASPDRLILLQHGFLASAPMYSYTAAQLAQNTHSIVVTLSLSSNFLDVYGAWTGGDPMHRAIAELFEGDRTALTASATAAAGRAVTLPTRFVLAGHSAGGGLALGVANHLDAESLGNLAGILMFDGVAMGTVTAADLIASLPADLPIMQIAGWSYGWNLYGDTTLALSQVRSGRFNGVELSGGRHMDSMQNGNLGVQLFVLSLGEFSLPWNVDAIQTLSSSWVNKMFTGATDYGTPGQTFTISTADGTATALPLPGSSGSLFFLDALIRDGYLFVLRLLQQLAVPTQTPVAASV